MTYENHQLADDLTFSKLLRHRQSRQSRIQSFAFVLSICVGLVLWICFIVSTPDGRGEPVAHQFKTRINPNDAPAASLVRLPGIGLSRAQAIITYRNNVHRHESNSQAFYNHDDLQKIKGIGPKTVQKISQWLKFE